MSWLRLLSVIIRHTPRRAAGTYRRWGFLRCAKSSPFRDCSRVVLRAGEIIKDKIPRGLPRGILFVSTLLLTACVNPQTELRRGQLSFQEQNYHDAFIRLTPLAKSGNARAQYAIGYMYFYGQGITENRDRGITWMQRAARQGQPQAVAALKMLTATPGS